MKMILSSRYKNDGVATLPLNDLQQSYIQKVEDKIKAKVYNFETVPCAVCMGTSMESIAQKDRYGFEVSLVVCKTCGLAQTNPRMNQESYNQFYNHEYRYIYGGEAGPTEAFFTEQYFMLGKKIFNFIQQTRGNQSLEKKLVLEVGCGAGGILKYFSDQGCTVKGIDLGSEFITYGKEKHGLDLSVGDLSTLTLSKQPDIIIYSHVLEHILDLNNQLKKISSLMHKDTVLYVEVPGLKNLHQSYDTDLLLYLQNAHVYHFTKTSLLNLMQANGFDALRIDEYVRSLFKKVDSNAGHVTRNEYSSIVAYLKKIEWMRKTLPVPLYVLKFRIKRTGYNILRFFKLVGPLE